MNGPPPIRVLIADDDAQLRRAVADVIGSSPGMVVVSMVADADQAIAAAERDRPDVALLDVKMPSGGGPRAAREIAARVPATRVVALSAHDDREAIASMLRAGAIGYVVKGASIDEIVEAVTRAARGLASLSGEAAATVALELEEQMAAGEREVAARAARTAEVRAALAPGVIRPVFQPIVDLETGDAVGFEALARFELEPRRPPDAWFRAAAEVEMLEELEFAALRAAVVRYPDLPRATYLSLNVSPASAMSDELHAVLVGVPPRAVVLEVTEHAEVTDYAALRTALLPITQAGGRLAVDDAGSGFASLRHILRLEPSIIKLDISIVRGIDTDRARRALGSALASFAREMGISLVAEGIETRSEFDALRQLGVHQGQGYFLGRPTADPTRPPPIGSTAG